MDELQVQTQAGQVQGFMDDGVQSFLGIPFAQPPVGALRFLPPRPCEPWQGTYAADTMRPGPPQHPMHGMFKDFLSSTTGTDEDCLYLNVWRSGGKPGQKLPVMFWIYGGAYASGSAGIDVYHGAALARSQDVVVVTANYRVGLFGFLSHPALDGKAEHTTNAGLWDIIAGLEWVRDNIEAFGGDPDNVTIFGESAGSAAVNTLLVCPRAEGLFHRAISQSFSPFNHIEWDHDKEQMQQRTARYLQTVGVETPEQLYAAPTQTLLGNEKDYMAAEFSPYIDGDLLPEPLEAAFLNGHIHDVPVMMGCTADEATVLIGDRSSVTREAFDATLDRKYPAPEHQDFLRKQYAELLDRDPAEGLARFRSDNTLANMRFFASVVSRANQSPVYFYRFARHVPGKDSDFYKAFHGGELPYCFGNLGGGRPFDEQDKALSRSMMAYWAAFARGGNPNVQGQPEWQAFTPRHDAVMELNAVCQTTPFPNQDITDFLQGLLVERTKAYNPGLDVPELAK